MRVFRVVSALDSKDLCEKLDSLDGIAIRPDIVSSTFELDLALHLAKSSFGRKKNIARKLKYEFLLWLAGKTDIKSAMEATCPKEGGEFLLVVFGTERDILGKLEAAERPLNLEKEAGPLALERISLSRI